MSLTLNNNAETRFSGTRLPVFLRSHRYNHTAHEWRRRTLQALHKEIPPTAVLQISPMWGFSRLSTVSLSGSRETLAPLAKASILRLAVGNQREHPSLLPRL